MLLDTSGLLCLVLRAELHHDLAITIYREAPRKVTHGYILAEWVALAQVRGVPRQLALDFASDLATNPDIETVWISEELHHAAVELPKVRLDKTYSLCDAVSFVLMTQLGLVDALTTDRHFDQEGFRRLLK